MTLNQSRQACGRPRASRSAHDCERPRKATRGEKKRKKEMVVTSREQRFRQPKTLYIVSEAHSRSSSSTALRPCSVRTGMPVSMSLSKYVGINLKMITSQVRGPTSGSGICPLTPRPFVSARSPRHAASARARACAWSRPHTPC